MHAKKTWKTNSLLRSSANCGYHAAVGELLAWNREPKSAVGMYCGDLSDTELKVITRLPQVTCWY